MDFSLKKHEILRSKKKITELFNDGSSFFIYPFKVYYLPDDGGGTNRILFSVSKRYFKRAVDRNLIRRRMREAYRLNKNILNTGAGNNISLSIGLVYLSREILSFKEIENKLKQILVRLNKAVQTIKTESE